MLGEVFKAEQRELQGEDARKTFQGRQIYADAGVLVPENLPVTPERACDSTPVVANRDDMGMPCGSVCPRNAQQHEFRKRDIREVVKVHPDEGPPVSSTDCSAHRVHTIFIWADVHWTSMVALARSVSERSAPVRAKAEGKRESAI